jgi:predicted phosphate transport protein (TIGR00153 family)
MFPGELELQAKRKTITVLQDESRKVVDGVRDLSLAFNAILSKNPKKVKEYLDGVVKAEQDAESLRRSLTRDLAELGTMVLNREDLLRSAYNIEEIASYSAGIAFRLSQLRHSTLKSKSVSGPLRELIDLAVEAVQRLNQMVRALAINPITALDLAASVEKIEKQVDDSYRQFGARLMKSVKSVKELILLKDVMEGIEDLTDRCLAASDSITILALGL